MTILLYILVLKILAPNPHMVYLALRLCLLRLERPLRIFRPPLTQSNHHLQPILGPMIFQLTTASITLVMPVAPRRLPPPPLFTSQSPAKRPTRTTRPLSAHRPRPLEIRCKDTSLTSSPPVGRQVRPRPSTPSPSIPMRNRPLALAAPPRGCLGLRRTRPRPRSRCPALWW